ncbi:MAG: hypothetical protein C0428_05205 [Polaromonas sp.]|nr:hypothetical protein [Polaromonas sp.]
MNVSELFQLTEWIRIEIAGQDITGKYQSLQAILQQNAQQGQQSRSFESQRTTLLDTLRSVNLEALTKDQLTFLDCLGIKAAVGATGASAVEDLLYRNVIDIATSAAGLARINKRVTAGIAKSQQLAAGLADCVPAQVEEQQGEVLMRVAFMHGASMSDLSDFKSWGSTWFDIGRGIAMAHGTAPEDIKVVGAARGSIIIELGVAYAIAATTSHIILEALKVAEKILALRKTVEEIKAMKLQNKKLASDLEKEIETEKSSGIDRIADGLKKQLKLKADEGDKVTALTKAVKHLVNFIERGGEVDFVVPNDEEAQEETADGEPAKQALDYQVLRDRSAEIRLLEGKLALLDFTEPTEGDAAESTTES